ncbi:alpha/beta hydrolase fold domain-containing protein [Streptomyces sp. NPDC050422]|uniref:alpha/beta hydrolase fold domain-containing protein n=1 Tax=Streptomyces sp. NPDC050422 TaxID=3365614 RepID=UPI0037A04BC8
MSPRTEADDRADAEQRGRNATLMQTYVEGLASTSPPGPTAPAPAVTVLRDLVFSEPGTTGGELRLDLYLPEDVPGPRPVIVWLPGGGWQRAARGMGPHLGRLFAQRGYAMADVEYRSSRTAIWPAQLHDVKAAVRYLRSVAQERGLDAERIGVWGSSAGGHLAALLGLTGGDPVWEGEGGHAAQSSEVQAVVDGYGPADLPHMDTDRLPGGVVNDIDPSSPPWGLLGGPTKDRLELAAQASPVSHVSGPTAPFLILHGDADLLVGPRQSRRLFDALHDARSEATLVSVHGAGHGFFNTDALERTPPLPTTVHTTRCGERAPERPGALTSGLVERFFDRHLRRHFSD